jgi:hypothetical protein
MKNCGASSTLSKSQPTRKAALKAVFLKRQISKARTAQLRFAQEEKEFSVVDSTLYEESESPQTRMDYFDFSFVC